MKLPWMSRRYHKAVVEQQLEMMATLRHRVVQLEGELSAAREETKQAVDRMLVNARLAPVHPAEKVKSESTKIRRRGSMVDLARRLEARERG